MGFLISLSYVKKNSPIKGAINMLYVLHYYFVNAINVSFVLKLTNSKSLAICFA